MTFQYGGRKQKRRSTIIWVGLFIFAVYIMITLYSAYSLLENTSGKQKRQERGVLAKSTLSTEIFEVEVWGKAAIGLYFWEHIMEGNLKSKETDLVRLGEKIIDNVKFSFRTGPGIIPQTVPKNSQNVILILNGRVREKIKFAEMWLKSLQMLPNIKNVAVILLGNEQCNNNWLLPYMVKQGGLVNIAYIVYDIPNQGNTIFQWPLGVATYRNFPKVILSESDISHHRQYMCNFLGTVYPNSSRETLQKIFYEHKLYTICYLRLRETWQPTESKETANEYYHALLHSDLTLSPVGVNTECYRLYEACSYGSVPVVEDIQTPGNCLNTPLKLLKYYNAPFIYLKSWAELPEILEKEKQLTLEQKIQRRENLLRWYWKFKRKLQQSFVVQIKRSFFSYLE
ncbi:Hypothetical predicted protein [Paramuricea clavata]|uniref:Uncharacterized protein n=1 Tax=Paramuricea clavata TaxID=317549 RepID=A0A7D9DFR3_PARCT|nr:Hypothetical predicted protein [Paramuricea clavata]